MHCHTGGATVTPETESTFILFAQSSWKSLHQRTYRLCGDWHEAEDLVQITLSNLYERWPRLTDHDQIIGYSHRTLFNAYVSRKRRRFWTHEVTCSEVPEGNGPRRDQFEDEVLIGMLVAGLSPRQRMVVMLRFWNDLTLKETALTLGCTSGSVAVHARRALTVLREALLNVDGD